MSEIKSAYFRNDGFNPSVKCDDPIVKTYTHKQFVKKLGKTEDDFILEEKPVLIDTYNVQKRIDEEAKTTDLKYLLSKLLLQNDGLITGQEPELNVKQGFYGDITGVQSFIESEGTSFVDPEKVKATLPEEFAGLATEELANMSDQEILDYVKKYREGQVKPVVQDQPVIQESEVK